MRDAVVIIVPLSSIVRLFILQGSVANSRTARNASTVTRVGDSPRADLTSALARRSKKYSPSGDFASIWARQRCKIAGRDGIKVDNLLPFKELLPATRLLSASDRRASSSSFFPGTNGLEMPRFYSDTSIYVYICTPPNTISNFISSNQFHRSLSLDAYEESSSSDSNRNSPFRHR